MTLVGFLGIFVGSSKEHMHLHFSKINFITYMAQVSYTSFIHNAHATKTKDPHTERTFQMGYG